MTAASSLISGKRFSILLVGDNETWEHDMSAVISSVENHGSIVIVWLEVEGAEHPVYVDHRAFGWLVEGEGIESVTELEGRSVHFDGETIEFLDFLEAA